MERCREIVKKTPVGESVPPEDIPFLMEFFQHHNEWSQKSSKGVKDIIIQTVGQFASRGFGLILCDDQIEDISFKYIVENLEGSHTRTRLPQAVNDYKSAARHTVLADIRTFRDAQLALNLTCPISGQQILRENCQVDHEPPSTFDKLLFDFTGGGKINPLQVKVGSRNGVEPFFEDKALSDEWIDFHREFARLRLLSIMGHSQVKSPRIDWSPLINR